MENLTDYQRNKLNELREEADHSLRQAQKLQAQYNHARVELQHAQEASGAAHSNLSRYIRQLVRIGAIKPEEGKDMENVNCREVGVDIAEGQDETVAYTAVRGGRWA